MFLQALESVHQFSVACPQIYFGCLICLVLVVSKGWYTLGKMQPAAIGSPAPASALARRRIVFYPCDHAVMVLIANLVFIGRFITDQDTIAATVAVKVT
jgi:hypothetical protein